jgi:hypothetical protein
MKVIVARTKEGRMSDMYVLKFPPIATRFICFTKRDWEKEFPNVLLQRGEKKEMDLHLTTEKKEV